MNIGNENEIDYKNSDDIDLEITYNNTLLSSP